MWIARDKNGLIYGHEKKPIKNGYAWYNPGWIAILPSQVYPEVKWSDKEPKELILK